MIIHPNLQNNGSFVGRDYKIVGQQLPTIFNLSFHKALDEMEEAFAKVLNRSFIYFIICLTIWTDLRLLSISNLSAVSNLAISNFTICQVVHISITLVVLRKPHDYHEMSMSENMRLVEPMDFQPLPSSDEDMMHINITRQSNVFVNGWLSVEEVF
ncbi:hypothetical protein BDB00DRAFT_793810 [Zychaea mexicana]|uniref:uncharacterized protein n=1 Tax=Zychaea mexicana TaxID=64656 RepID=UPI0022FED866|nr:uncharacterized protein BDB00DRAFT_793810 [Zychaea mexicana]KAI9467710.1 hypothetical protein BDB00DRAFT_793810 [Zychaea mexicana]